MEIENELTKLYNTLMLIETRGESTRLMGQCLTFVDALRTRVIAEKNNRKEEGSDD